MGEGGFGSHGDGAGVTPDSCGAFIFPFTFLLPFPFLPAYWFAARVESGCMIAGVSFHFNSRFFSFKKFSSICLVLGCNTVFEALI